MSTPTYSIALTADDIAALQAAIDDSCYAHEMNIEANIDTEASEEAINALSELSRRLEALLPKEKLVEESNAPVAVQSVSLIPEVKYYRCNAGHEFKSRYPFALTITLGTGILGEDITASAHSLCPYCLAGALAANFSAVVVGGEGLLATPTPQS